LSFEPNASRPLSPKIRKAFLQRIANQQISERLDPAERFRIESRIRQLKEDPDPARLLRSWIKDVGENINLSANPEDLAKLRLSKDVKPAGASHPESGMVDQSLFEAYVERSRLNAIVKSHLLVKSDNPNVLLKVVDEPVADELLPALLMADLARRYGPRERNSVKELVKKL
jgi:hypothetical protein